MWEAYRNLAARLFGGVSQRSLGSFVTLKPHLRGAQMGIMLNTWVSITLFSTFLAYAASLAAILIIGTLLSFETLTLVYIALFGPVMAASFVFVFFYVYPVQRASSIRNSIDSNLPFALSHMSAITSAGIPPEFMFELIMGFKEYGEIARQAGQVVRNIKTFGMSSVDALRNMEEATPSPDFKQVLSGIRSTIEKGGNLTKYLEEMSDRAFFDYRVKRESYLKTLSTYSDVYTAVMITAPLMMLIVLGTMSAIGADVMGMAIEDVLFLITWLMLPAMNVIFLAFLHVTFPQG
jgi:flagellar protein FlaJ